MEHIYDVRLFEGEPKWRTTKRLKKLPDRSLVAATPEIARRLILAAFRDEGRRVYFLYLGLRNTFHAVVGPPATPPPKTKGFDDETAKDTESAIWRRRARFG